MKITYKSLYPSIDLENNIAPNTQIGKIEIENKVYEDENRYANPKYSRGGEFIENLVCDNIVLFSHRWLHLANFEEMLMDIDEFYNMTFNVKLSVNSFLYSDYVFVDNQYVTCPFEYVPDKVIKPFVKVDSQSYNPFRSYAPRGDLK